MRSRRGRRSASPRCRHPRACRRIHRLPTTWTNPFTSPLLSDLINPRESRTYDGLTLRAEHSFSFGDLTSISSYRHFNTYNREEQDGTNRIYLYFDDVNIEQNTSFSQEFTLGGKTALADWVGGVSYYYDDANQDSQVNLYTDSIDTLLTQTRSWFPAASTARSARSAAPLGIPVNLLGLPWQENMYNHLYARAYAAYGDVIWHLGSQLEPDHRRPLHARRQGLQLVQPDAHRGRARRGPGGAARPGSGFPLPPFPYTQNIAFNYAASLNAPLRMHDSWNDTSPRVVLDYKPQPGIMYYLSYGKGYQAGGYNALLPGATLRPRAREQLRARAEERAVRPHAAGECLGLLLRVHQPAEPHPGESARTRSRSTR